LSKYEANVVGLPVVPSTATNVEFFQVSGEVNFMRIQELGQTFGPPSDSIATEVVT
jgi:hypothetical protein